MDLNRLIDPLTNSTADAPEAEKFRDLIQELLIGAQSAIGRDPPNEREAGAEVVALDA
jgi:hypothetical protein